MCGVAGCVDLRREGRVDPTVVAAMTATLIHRGPDSCGHFALPDVALGVRRLRIIDLETGDQPIYNEDGSVVLVCNGEIFNYRELRRELQGRGHVFSTRTDVEVLVHLYEELGVDLLQRLNGQFAFALYDCRLHRLLLARDHFGINPLFYAVVDEQLIFASEIKAVLAHPAVERRVDLEGLDQVLSLPGLVSPRTLFRGVESLPSGHWLRVAEGRLERSQYWDLDYPPGEIEAARSEEFYVDGLRELLVRSVGRRLQADVPVGLFLSGGVDSSLVGRLAVEAVPGIPRHSFSVSFADPEIDEGRYQRQMARVLGCEHHEICIDVSAIAEGLRRMVLHCECPVKETFNTCALALSEAARVAGVTVVLAGQGADELFGGYPGYRFDGAGARPTHGSEVEAAFEAELRERLWGDPDLFYERDHVPFREVKGALYSAAVNAVFSEVDCLRQPLVDPARLRGRHPIHKRSYLDFKLRLADHLLSEHGDRMVMANSVEARYPFLDLELVDFVRGMPPSLKVNGMAEKYIVKRIADGLIPHQILNREKFGFRAPGSPLLLQQKVEWFCDLLSAEQVRRLGYFDVGAVERLKARYGSHGFRLHPHLETDLLMVVATFNLCCELFALPSLN